MPENEKGPSPDKDRPKTNKMTQCITSSPEDQENITFKKKIDIVYPVTNEKVKFFSGHGDALVFWLYAATLPDDFKLTKTEMLKIVNCPRRRWTRAIDFLKTAGLLHMKYRRDGYGRITGSEYTVSDFYNAPIMTLKPPSIGHATEMHNTVISDKNPESKSPINTIRSPNLLEGDILDVGKDFDGIPETQIPFQNDNPEEHKKEFLKHFSGELTFQTFDDKKKTQRFNKVIHGHKNLDLELLNQNGAGVFLTVNRTDGSGRKTENIKKVRAAFVDLDGAPLPPVLKYNPSMVTETSPGRFHAYWLCDDMPLEKFTPIQKALALKFNGDKTVHDLPRVARVPGYYHQKSDQPFLVKIIYTSSTPMFTCKDIEGFTPHPLKTTTPRTYPAHAGNVNHRIPSGAPHGERHPTLKNLVSHMAMLGKDIEEIRAAAHTFGSQCSPAMPAREVEDLVLWSKKI